MTKESLQKYHDLNAELVNKLIAIGAYSVIDDDPEARLKIQMKQLEDKWYCIIHIEFYDETREDKFNGTDYKESVVKYVYHSTADQNDHECEEPQRYLTMELKDIRQELIDTRDKEDHERKVAKEKFKSETEERTRERELKTLRELRAKYPEETV